MLLFSFFLILQEYTHDANIFKNAKFSTQIHAQTLIGIIFYLPKLFDLWSGCCHSCLSLKRLWASNPALRHSVCASLKGGAHYLETFTSAALAKVGYDLTYLEITEN